MADPLNLAHEIMKRVEQQRQDLDMDQKELGALIGRSQSMISNWMARNSIPTLTNLCALAQALGLKVVVVKARADDGDVGAGSE